jgi:adenosylhomocysteine nucleosidase
LKIGFLAAMPSELRPLARSGGLRPAHVGGLDVQRGSVGAATVVAITTGIGMRAAASAAARLLDATPLDHVIVIGIAGGVGSSVAIGDVIVPDEVLDARTGQRYRPALLQGLAPRGILRSGDELVESREAGEALAARGVVAVDMETAAVAAVCDARGCLWSVVRAISDRAGETPLEIFALANSDGSPNLAAAAAYVLRSPGRIPELVRLARGSTRAARAAAAAAVRACAALQGEG